MTKIAIIQTPTSAQLLENVHWIEQAVIEVANQGAKWVALPEECFTLGLEPQKRVQTAEVLGHGPLQEFLSQLAKKCHIWLVGGTCLLKEAKSNKWYSSCLCFDPNGHRVARYDKIHLFDAVLSKHEKYQESDTLNAGKTLCLFDSPFSTFALGICYDLRFPELFRKLVFMGAEAFVIPSAFTYQTGQAHWEILLRARAIENLAFVIAPNQAGVRYNGQRTYGHSMIISPWGEVLLKLGDDAEVGVVDIDFAQTKKIRQTFQALEHSVFKI